ncbi:unnamed protein product [Schistosoma margrebowiei]|uniref:Selenoprotein O n=1 Tax=Schistosoma margrebowiei TaxID=48269 RepID=A0A183LUW4_9TREM|nr:unnamed protein product [Schistosoma margrebowiei]
MKQKLSIEKIGIPVSRPFITYLGFFSNTVNKQTHMLLNTCSSSERSSWSKHCPQFDNIQLKCLPIDNGSNSIRSVPNACFTQVSPTRIDNPRVVLFSLDALSLLNIRHEVDYLDEQNCKEKTGETNHLVEYLSGNKLWPGSDPTAHCYCGYQFGNFAGQLGDGAAMYAKSRHFHMDTWKKPTSLAFEHLF